ncbi:protein phosphatase 1 regulatory subunit 12A-like isoform X1 [Gigantopelta aegis]|uniref:protein phosphatase 1 regulatory subunit 12A-like isoform X1 n=1 Tax=Gigantopelta aegis TaxID=1735272 RepID=UPI001B88D0CB|nr:protein phosphatase 1 regulatory subunit 12A-like isoform X1 [Gigantopelta aegis]
MADDKQVSALMRRHDQLKRWEDSDTAKESNCPKAKSRKVQFQDGCVFLAACSSSDTEEVKRLLERGADINTANVDGLTALHQACIDDNLDMVEFLVANGADVNVCDNEGWTPLHATASCGFTEIARYLIKEGADIAAVNNDGDLPIDICEDEEKMENLLQEEMDKQGVDADAARRNEEERMLMDANQWLNSRVVKEKKHHKSGATALHVAAAKGYIKVMNILIQAGVDINAEDNDGWTPLHAAAHWGQNEACIVLVENMCDMEKKDHAGLTPFDIADTDMVVVLEDLKKKQIQLKNKAAEMDQEIIQTKGQTGKRRSSVTRMSGDQKQNVLHRSAEQERPPFEANLFHNKEDDKKAESYNEEEGESEETGKEIERKNELNKQTSHVEKPWEQDFTPSHAGVDLKRTEMPKIDEVSESENISRSDETVRNGEQNAIVTKIEDETPAVIKDSPATDTPQSNREISNSVKDNNKTSSKDLVSRSISAPSSLPTEEQGSKISMNHTSLLRDRSIHSWRAGLRKTGSLNMVNDSINKAKEDGTFHVPASNHYPHIIENDHYGNQRNVVSTSSVPSTTAEVNQDNRLADRHSFVSSYGRSATSPYRSLHSTGSSYQSAYVPYYRRQQEQNERKDSGKESDKQQDDVLLRSRTTTTTAPSTTVTIPASVTTASTTIYTTTTVTSPTSNISMFRRSYEPPKRDEEAETQRKARAKRARETRRSTQGVALEDVEQAQESIKHSSTDQDREKLRLQNNKETDKDNSSVSITKRDSVRDSQKDSLSDRTSSSLSSKDTPADETSTYHRRWEDHRDDSRSSFRRSRDSTRDNSSSLGSHTSDSISSYIPRSQRNAVTSSDPANTSSLTAGSTGLSRTSSLRSRIRNGELDDTRNELSSKEHKTDTKEDNKDESKKDGHEEKKELSLVRARRARRERRSTGIVSYDPENDEDKEGKENKPEESSKEDQTDSGSIGSRYGSGRYSSTVDRPSSYSEYSRSTPALDTDYKKLYDEERLTNDKLRKEIDQLKKTEETETKRLRKELEQTKRELREAKAELDRVMKRSELARDSSDKREKRAMERKLSELEEELKKMDSLKSDNNRLREENGALIRVISKLSK